MNAAKVSGTKNGDESAVSRNCHIQADWQTFMATLPFWICFAPAGGAFEPGHTAWAAPNTKFFFE
jgi:hypothetical protein